MVDDVARYRYIVRWMAWRAISSPPHHLHGELPRHRAAGIARAAIRADAPIVARGALIPHARGSGRVRRVVEVLRAEQQSHTYSHTLVNTFPAYLSHLQYTVVASSQMNSCCSFPNDSCGSLPASLTYSSVTATALQSPWFWKSPAPTLDATAVAP